MKALKNIAEKHSYSKPVILRVELDNEISLALESTNATPAPGPGEPGYIGGLEQFNPDPMKTHLT